MAIAKNVHDLPDNWKETMVTLYAQGCSDTEVRSELNMTYRLWKHLLMTDVEFEDVVLHGRMLAKAWWMKQGRVNLENRGFNALLFKINMQNRFNWNDKTAAVEDSDEEDYDTPEEIDEAIKKFTMASGEDSDRSH